MDQLQGLCIYEHGNMRQFLREITLGQLCTIQPMLIQI